MGEDPRIKRLFKGIYNLRPGKPKYDSTWDPHPVLEHVVQWGLNDTISIEHLTFKLVTLLALITAQRMQTLAVIDIRNVEKTTELIEIKIPDRIKTSRVNKTQPTLIIHYYTKNPAVCAALTLETYINRI